MKYLAIMLLITLVIGACTTTEPTAQDSKGTETEGKVAINVQTPEEPVNTGETTGITNEELSSHNTQADCWIGFKGKVYDITDWLPRHPGSAGAIAPYCGTSDQFETAFIGQHGNSKINKLFEEGTLKGDLQ